MIYIVEVTASYGCIFENIYRGEFNHSVFDGRWKLFCPMLNKIQINDNPT